MVNTHEHLTTEQLSALIDKQLSMEEEAICRVHLQTCEQCQERLAGLQQTSALLRAMPQLEVPRSFALLAAEPTGVRYLQDRPERQAVSEEQEEVGVSPAARRRSWSYYVQRSLRATSTIAAVAGLVFLLSGVLPLVGAINRAPTGTVPSASTANNHVQSNNRAAPNSTATSKAQISGDGQTSTVGKLAPQNTPRPVNTPGFVKGTPVETGHQNATPPEQPQPSIIDLNTPLGRQEVGFVLLFLGIVGVLLTRRRRPKAERG